MFTTLQSDHISTQHTQQQYETILKLLENVVYKICCHQCTHLMSQLINSKATGIFNPLASCKSKIYVASLNFILQPVKIFEFKL